MLKQNTVKRKIIQLLFLLYFPLFLPAQDPMQTRTQVLMGTFVTITLPQTDSHRITGVFAHIKEIENALSSYDIHASLGKLNKDHHVNADPYLTEAINLSRAYYDETNGYFDITIGSISKDLYHFGEENTYSPSKKALQDATLNIDGIYIEDTEIKSDENISIDLGGMGKGYGVDKVASYLKDQNVTEGIIALSGDIRCLNACEILLQSPYSNHTFARIKSKDSDLSISTSGTYRRYATTKEEHHLINPKTASQGKEFVSVSLFSRADNAKIDAYATALAVMPKDEALTFLKTHKDIAFVLVDTEGKILYGNITDLVTLEWLDYSEKASMPSISTKSITNNAMETSLIHPDTSNPKLINR
jgi:thiamine biosynthesis lipoprotein